MYIQDKPIAAVRLETCLQDADGSVSEYGLERMKELAETYYVVVVSPKTVTPEGTRLVYHFLTSNDVRFDDVWASPGIPAADAWFDTMTETF